MVIKVFDHVLDRHGFLYVVRSIKDLKHPRTPVIYIPSGRFTGRLFENKNYIKLADETGFVFVKENFKDLLYVNPISKEEYVSVNLESITKIFDPVSKLGELMVKDSKLKDFVEILLNEGVERKDIGIIGSNLVGFENQNFHDFDFVIYGRDNFMKLRNSSFRQNLEYLTEEQKRKIAIEVGLKNNPIGLENILKITSRRQKSVMMFGNKEFSLKFADRIYEIFYDYPDLEPEKEMIFKGELIEDDSAYFPPYTYKVLTERKIKLQISTYSFAFIGSSQKGDNVEVFGTKRKGENLVTLDKPYHYLVSLK